MNPSHNTCRSHLWPRRDVLRAGAISFFGLTAPQLAALRAAADEPSSANSQTAKHRRNACVFVFLFGGPSHIDLWDMKPEAPAEIRGEFQPVATSVPGIQICEHLPKLAQSMHRFCLLRSMTHHMPVHGPACSEMYSGREYFGPPTTDQALPQDWPSVAALAMRFGSGAGGLPPSIVLPWYTQFDGQDKRIAGQSGGRMGEQHNPLVIDGDPSRSDFRVEGLQAEGDVSPQRVLRRRGLLSDLESRRDHAVLRHSGPRSYGQHQDLAFSMLGSTSAGEAFDLSREPEKVRDRYGRTKFGQSLLLARRIVEAGGSLVTVNWDDETKREKVSPFWDTHNHNFPKLKDHLCPRFDLSFSAFLEDLDERGLLETTLVVVTGEFGRTPKIGQFTQNAMTERTGRDHWPHAFTVLLAGGGVRGGQVYGATNKIGGFVADKPVTPGDLAATIFWQLGIDPSLRYFDEFQRTEQRLAEGKAIKGLS
ncbi:MAG: DUF1501 domain-containing protein [Planctomycetia bacterium]|nr:DUF1501 domain-containing protein [Planctomycetia bacterium]